MNSVRAGASHRAWAGQCSPQSSVNA